jgi:hypothetical protein
MKKVDLTNEEHERLISLIKWRLKCLPYELKERKERDSGNISFGSEHDKEAFEDNKRSIKKIESNIKLYKSIINKL